MADRPRSFLEWLSRPESMIGLSAVIVSLVAVSVSVYDARIQRDWQRASVWPHVELSRSYSFDGGADIPADKRQWHLRLSAENVGVGPAKIEDFHVTVDGKPYRNWGEALGALHGGSEKTDYGHSTINGAVLPSDRAREVLVYDKPDAKEIADAIANRLDFSACYCSIFEECWRSSYRSSKTEKVDRCVKDADSFEQ